jgi:hypothetical protein
VTYPLAEPKIKTMLYSTLIEDIHRLLRVELFSVGG